MSEIIPQKEKSAFSQQRLSAIKPVYTAKLSSLIFLLVSLILFAFGIILYVENNNQQEYEMRYDLLCENNSSCSITLKIDSTMKSPVAIYYQLTNFHQNHRLYIKSKSYTQLRGDSASSSELSLCSPARYNSDFIGYYTKKTLDPSETARPCGLIARSVFNDSFSINSYEIDSRNIVNNNDRRMYKIVDPEKEWTAMDEHFISWAKIAPLATFRKLYGRIHNDIEPGNLTINIQNHYSVHHWGGKKAVILATNGMFGGHNVILGVIFIGAGVVSFLFSMVFALAMLGRKKRWMSQDPRSWKY